MDSQTIRSSFFNQLDGTFIWLKDVGVTGDVFRDVFSQAVRARNAAGMTYSQMEAKTWEVGGKEESRSSGWWNNMANYHMDTPPAPKYIPGIAEVLKMSEREVKELIAEQWYGVRPDDRLPRRLRTLVATARRVARVDLVLLNDVARALGDKHSAETEVEELKEASVAAEEDN
ncbi:hypothetical protein HW130_18550 [Streptomyces sp. PKU-EA00015]|uniref:hypothetical protein n=1 Tax=Streptomyces sp. PKU-EA00015 TaxID=2748326 RepID=UPI0015A351B7|nr:hypothetical protein [Streptomyces sp. PKU-EA00015]NWF28244.1 hypothetical protein [Streptomyces sp. PKU-EA00015]